MTQYDPKALFRQRDAREAPEPNALSRTPSRDAITELSGFLLGISTGDLSVAAFTDWPILSQKTQWGCPGTITMVIGDPGVGKTFWVLQALRGWVAAGIESAVLFIEKDAKFHTHRLLAQLEENGRLLDWQWLRENGQAAQDAIEKHEKEVAAVGQQIWSSPLSAVTLGSVGAWIRQRAEAGARVIVVDPITAADAGDTRWRADKDFVLGIQRVLNDYGASLILINHPKQQSGREKNPTGHSQAGSSAFFNFSDTDLWLRRLKTVKKVEMTRTADDVPWKDSLDTFIAIHKARFGRGTRDEIGFRWNKMKFIEQGVVLRDVKEDTDEAGTQQELLP